MAKLDFERIIWTRFAEWKWLRRYTADFKKPFCFATDDPRLRVNVRCR